MVVTGGNHQEDGEKNTPNISRGGTTRSWGTTISGQSVSTSGSEGSPSSRSEQTMATPAGENTFSRLNQLNIRGDDAGSQGGVVFGYVLLRDSAVKKINPIFELLCYYEEMTCAAVQETKHISMALINAYVNCGQYEKAKQVVLEQGIPVKNMNEIKSALISALALSGQTADALKIYEEIKQAGSNVEPKAILNLIEHIQTEGQLNKHIELLGELNDLVSWLDACSRVIQYCVRNKHLSSAVNLLKQLKYKDELATDAALDQAFSQISEMEPKDLQTGLDLLQAIKDELGLLPSRTSLDFLLSSCVNAKDPKSARLVYDEYQKVGLPYNVLTYLRMYQVLLASGEHTSTKNMLKKIPKDDPHVCHVIQACKKVYGNSKSVKKKKKLSTAFL